MKNDFEFRKRITEFILDYLTVPDFHFDEDGLIVDQTIRMAFDILIIEHVFTQSELQQTLLSEYMVFVPNSYFEKHGK